MAPKRGRPSKAVSPLPSSSSMAPISDIAEGVEGAISKWDGEGQATLRELLAAQVARLAEEHYASIPLSHALMALLQSSIPAPAVATFLGELVGTWDEDQVACLGEVLVDVIEILEEEHEDLQDLGGVVEAVTDVEADGGHRGIEVIKLLQDAIPAHIPNLLFSPERLLAIGLHPVPHAPQALQRNMVKKNTTLFYKQSKYNLLRESSEGFSGLIVLLTSRDALTSHPTEEDSADRLKRAKRVWDKVMALIGYFNLSPPRVLDLILEVASCHVAEHWRFWMDLIGCSPWGVTGSASRSGKGKGRAVGDWATAEQASIEGVLDGVGDRVLAQVLGVKFGFYQKPDGGDAPMGLVYIAALLIKHGFVSFADLLPFLSPDDAEMGNIHKRFLFSLSARSGPSNALSNSVLLDDDAPTSTTTAEEATGAPPKPPPEQRIQLLQALLAIGDLPASLYFLAKFPWIAQSHLAIADLILRNVHYALQEVYRHHWSSSLEGEEGEVGLDDAAPTFKFAHKQIVPTLLSPPPPETPTKIFEFFYQDWRDGCEQWTHPSEIHEKGMRWLTLLRGMGSRMVEVMVMICRLGAAHFAALRKAKEAASDFAHGAKTREEIAQVEPTTEEMTPWLDIIRVVLLPALSASSATAAFDIELWAMLKFFPYPVRYCLYGEWRDSTCNFSGRAPCPIAAHAAAESTREVKKALSRVTAASSAPPSGPATADRGPARSLAKLSHSNPCALWESAVKQVRSYSNIGQYIVEAGRYMTQLSMDVAAFTLVDTLSDDRQSRINEQGTGIAAWLENLSVFTGDFNRRFAQMDLEPVLQFIINRLMRGESLDLSILQSLLSIMSGTTFIDNDAISDDQIRAYATGREMVREAFNMTVLQISRPAEGDPVQKAKEAPLDKTKSIKKSLPRLVNALRDTSLAMPIWIALAQTRQGAVDTMASTPIKAMSSMQDNCHDIFIQYGDLLSDQLTADEFINLTPDLSSLVSDFGLDFAMAFQILRSRLNAEMERVRTERLAARQAATQSRLYAERQALTARLASPTEGEASAPGSPASPAMAVDGDEVSDAALTAGDSDGGRTPGGLFIPPPRPGAIRPHNIWWPPALTSTMQQARALLPQEVNDVMSAPFFVIFWHLTISDIAYSAPSYLAAIDKITAMEKDVASWRATNAADQKAERKRLKDRVEVLRAEKDTQAALVKSTVQKRLKAESPWWFGKLFKENQLGKRLAAQLHQYCFYPRAILTPADAVFVAKFIRLLHDLGTTGFSTVFAYNNFFNEQTAASIFSCTVNEARNLGRCLGAIMGDLDAWHGDEAKYKREALGVGEHADGDATPLPGMLFKSKSGGEPTPMTWAQFRNFYAKSHRTLAKALVSCWGEKDFMHIKNAITVALQVIKYFPVTKTDGESIEGAVKKLIDTGDLTPDVQHQCNAYLRNLTTRQKTRPYVAPVAFHSVGQAASSATTTTAAAAATGRPATRGSVPSAPRAAGSEGEVKPNGSSTPGTAAGGTSSDPKVLRQKLEEQRQARANQAAKEEPKAKAEPAVGNPEDDAGAAAKSTNGHGAPPAGPRATRSTAAASPAGAGESTRANGGATATATAPTGPAKPPSGPSGLPVRPGAGASGGNAHGGSSMGPPASLSVDEERAAARARKFGTLSRGPGAPSAPAGAGTPPTGPSASATGAPTGGTAPPTAPSGPGAGAGTPRAKSPTPTGPGSRRNSPSRAGRRSGSIESKTSDRSRVSKSANADPGHDRDKSAQPDGETGRRSSRDMRGTERNGRDRERDHHGKDRDDGDGRKRRREDDGPRRIDPIGPDRRDDRGRDHPRDRERDRHPRDERRGDDRDRRDRDRDRDREREREARDGRDGRDRDRNSIREREREEDRRRGDRRERDPPRPAPGGPESQGQGRDHARAKEGVSDRAGDRPRRGRGRSAAPEPVRGAEDGKTGPATASSTGGAPPRANGGDTPNATATAPTGGGSGGSGGSGRELLPGPTGSGPTTTMPARPANDRIIEAPRTTRGNASAGAHSLPTAPAERDRDRDRDRENGGGRGHPSLPARPGPGGRGGPEREREERASRPSGGGDLASRMGPALNATSNSAPSDSNPAPSGSTLPPAGPRDVAEDRERERERDRKRPLEGDGTHSREDSPVGGAKRVRIDRDKVRRGRDAGGGRMLANAMRSANPNEQ